MKNAELLFYAGLLKKAKLCLQPPFLLSVSVIMGRYASCASHIFHWVLPDRTLAYACSSVKSRFWQSPESKMARRQASIRWCCLPRTARFIFAVTAEIFLLVYQWAIQRYIMTSEETNTEIDCLSQLHTLLPLCRSGYGMCPVANFRLTKSMETILSTRLQSHKKQLSKRNSSYLYQQHPWTVRKRCLAVPEIRQQEQWDQQQRAGLPSHSCKSCCIICPATWPPFQLAWRRWPQSMLQAVELAALTWQASLLLQQWEAA